MSVISDSILSHTAIVDEEITKPISNSKKTYVTGSRSDISVPMREIACSPTQTKKGLEENNKITKGIFGRPLIDDPKMNWLNIAPSSKAADDFHINYRNESFSHYF